MTVAFSITHSEAEWIRLENYHQVLRLFFMRPILVFSFLILIAGCGILRANSEGSFLKVGSWYKISVPKGMPMGDGSYNDSDSIRRDVKILEVAADQWCMVEITSVRIPGDKTGQVIISKGTFWLNFAQVVAVEPAAEPNFTRFNNKEQFPGGVKVLEYQGQ